VCSVACKCAIHQCVGMGEAVFSVAWKSLDPYDYASFWWMVSSPLDSFGRAHVLRVGSVYSHTFCDDALSLRFSVGLSVRDDERLTHKAHAVLLIACPCVTEREVGSGWPDEASRVQKNAYPAHEAEYLHVIWAICDWRVHGGIG